jgi:nucleoid-associated protein YgaU
MRPAEPVAPGSYQLRVDKVAPSGTVQARVAFPFVRADPLTDLPNNRLVVIQPGNNLWRIATRVYGSGFRYVEIFDANKDQILDPDLIYPGQVFGLPRVN